MIHYSNPRRCAWELLRQPHGWHVTPKRGTEIDALFDRRNEQMVSESVCDPRAIVSF